MEQVVDEVENQRGVKKMKAEECCCKELKTEERGFDCNRPNQPRFRSLVIEKIKLGSKSGYIQWN
jgi:hypothetical protein